MYIKSIDIKNIRSIEHFHWELDKADEDLAGWHVLIGDNGSGKSTILKAISLSLIGEYHAQALFLSETWQDWLTYNKQLGSIELQLTYDLQFDTINVPGANGESDYSNVANPKLLFKREGGEVMPPEGSLTSTVLKRVRRIGNGWFSVAYGPYRRFKGTQFPDESSRVTGKLLAHLSVFDESLAFTDTIKWLKELRFRELDKPSHSNILPQILSFINQEGFLLHKVRLTEISPNGVFFEDAKGVNVPIEQLGDGYRSILSMTLDIIRQMQIAYQSDDLFSDDGAKITKPGVVLIDEVDAHLHPEWQRTVGYSLIKLFPYIQFIVTTHSPLVCQAAGQTEGQASIRGSIWRLPAPGSEEKAHQITPDSEDWKRLVYGDILEAYSTDLFGENINRSPEAQAKFHELGELSIKEMEEPLTPEEEKRQQELLEQLPNVPSRELILSTLAEQGRNDKKDD